MAEFWWGESPKGEIRRHGQYYPSCKHKCEPILGFMLQGLDVEPNPLLITNTDASQLKTIYEDEYLLVVNKPAGMLSVPGKNGQESVQSLMRKRYPDATGPLTVHRLDMDTSGLLLVAKNEETHTLLQEQFEKREVKKRYIALLAGIVSSKNEKDFIRLPLRPDYDNCPLQLVDFQHGKSAVTRYEILGITTHFIDEKEHFCTRIAYYPESGRTHQLRVHSAHPDGMDCPILGDPLYGQAADRMYLHAESLQFRHPHTGQILKFTATAPF
jgi:tRNA pseudouridine32 synthase/23S rRNA pseudouridine746 synthase